MSAISTRSDEATRSETIRKTGVICGSLIGVLIGAICVHMGLLAFFKFVVQPSARTAGYLEGTCTIQSVRAFTVSSPFVRRRLVNPAARYFVMFNFTIRTADNLEYRIDGTSAGATFFVQESQMEDLLNTYQVGGVYSCWYNPGDPSQVVFYRDLPTLPLVMCGALIALGMFILLKTGSYAMGGMFAVPRVGRRRVVKK